MKKKNAKTAGSLHGQVDKEIGELANSESAAVAQAEDTPVILTPHEAALLSISKDLQNVLTLLNQIKNSTQLFETFIKAIGSEVNNLRRK